MKNITSRLQRAAIKCIVFLLPGMLHPVFLSGQNVDNLRVEQAGDFIKIQYQLLNSTPDQVFRVKVLCSINGGLNTELRSVSGDVGEMVPGGKPEYWVVWDVLKDLEELNSVEFIVRAELVRVVPDAARTHGKHRFTVMAPLQLQGPGVGVGIGFLGSFGISAQYIFPAQSQDKAVTIGYSGVIPKENYNRFSLDFTKRVINREALQVHLLTGITIGGIYIGEPDFKEGVAPGLDLGALVFIKRVGISLSGSRLLYELAEEGVIESDYRFLTLGIGYRF